MLAKTLSIAGFDGSGGAGIQADLKTFSAFGCYGMTVLTALPVQNTQGVKRCYTLPLTAIEEQLQAIFEDITPDAIKIGMLFNAAIIELVADFLANHAPHIPIVLDPVMIAKSGDPLLQPEAVQTLKEKLIPLATLLTPNLPEAAALVGLLPKKVEDMPEVAKKLLTLGTDAVLLKGGHLQHALAMDLLLTQDGRSEWFSQARVHTRNTHGTGCTLSAAITACLALKLDLPRSLSQAKHYLTRALIAGRDEKIGAGHGPVHHFYHLWPSLDKI